MYGSLAGHRTSVVTPPVTSPSQLCWDPMLLSMHHPMGNMAEQKRLDVKHECMNGCGGVQMVGWSKPQTQVCTFPASMSSFLFLFYQLVCTRDLYRWPLQAVAPTHMCVPEVRGDGCNCRCSVIAV